MDLQQQPRAVLVQDADVGGEAFPGHVELIALAGDGELAQFITDAELELGHGLNCISIGRQGRVLNKIRNYPFFRILPIIYTSAYSPSRKAKSVNCPSMTKPNFL